MLSGVQVDFDLTHMAQFGFAPVLTRQLDVLRMLRQLSQMLAQPDWQYSCSQPSVDNTASLSPDSDGNCQAPF
jgi:hypothetical protein